MNSYFYVAGRLFKNYVKPRLGMIATAIGFMIVYAVASAAQPMLMQIVFDKVFTENDPLYLKYIPLAIVAVMTLVGLSNFASTYIMSDVGLGIVNTMQKELYSHLVDFDMSFHAQHRSGDLVSRLTNDISLIRSAVSNLIIGAVKQLLTFVGLVAVMFYQNWQLSLIAFTVMLLIVYPLMKAAKRMRKLARQGQEQSADLVSMLAESFKGIRVIKAYQREDFEKQRLGIIMDQAFENKLKSARTSNINSPIIAFLSGVAVAAVIWYSGSQLAAGHYTQGQLVGFCGALLMVTRPLKALSGLSNIIQNAVVAAERVFALLDRSPDILDRPGSDNLNVKKGGISLENVSFAYENQNNGLVTHALKNVSFNIPAGKKVALVGHSGSGKSTVINLILRFFEPQKGKILVDDQDISEVKIKSLRDNISLVTQDIFLFDDTVRANISYGKENPTDEELETAAKMAVASEFIAKLPNKYDTKIGEDGIRLSGGQKQRISIARAVLRDTPILLLDEATSSLDTVAEREFQSALENLMAGKTTLMIAHRLSTVVNADLIYVMNEGEVADSGTHEELMQKSPIYQQLFELK